jgi:hypothetical protein
MTTPHRATPEQWATHRAWAASDDDSSCILELRSRIEALEAAQREAPMTELRAASAEARPAEGLIERVEEALANEFQPGGDWRDEARAAIREVAKWLRSELVSCAAADQLEHEADR